MTTKKPARLVRFGPEWWTIYAQSWGPSALHLLRGGSHQRQKDGSSELVPFDRVAFVKAAVRDADEAIALFNDAIDQI